RLLHHHRREPALLRAGDVAVAEDVPHFVIDRIAPVVTNVTLVSHRAAHPAGRVDVDHLALPARAVAGHARAVPAHLAGGLLADQDDPEVRAGAGAVDPLQRDAAGLRVRPAPRIGQGGVHQVREAVVALGQFHPDFDFDGVAVQLPGADDVGGTGQHLVGPGPGFRD